MVRLILISILSANIAAASNLENVGAASSYDDLIKTARSLRKEAKYLETGTTLLKAEKLAREKFGDQSFQVAFVLRLRGVNMVDREDMQAAIPLLKRSLAQFEALNDGHQDEIASLQNDLAAAYYFDGNLFKAEKLYSDALASRIKLHGNNHPDVAQTLNNIAWLQKQLDKPKEAEASFKKAIEIGKAANQPRDYASFVYGLAELYLSTGQRAKGLPLLEESVKLAKAAYPVGHQEVEYYSYRLKEETQASN